MRIEKYAVGSYIHITKRGARGLPITRDELDRQRFLRLLYYANDAFSSEFWEKETMSLGMFGRPSSWPKRDPLVKILAFCLMPNHFHIILKVVGRSDLPGKFMQKLCGSMSMNFNSKYGEKGSIFQGAYRSRTINNDSYLRNVAIYVMIKNTMELYPQGGLDGSIQHFGKAWGWAIDYPYSSLGDFVGNRNRPIIEKDIYDEIWLNKQDLIQEGQTFLNQGYVNIVI